MHETACRSGVVCAPCCRQQSATTIFDATMAARRCDADRCDAVRRRRARAGAKGSADHIKAVTGAVDGAAIIANAKTTERLAELSASTMPRRASASSTRSTPTTSSSSACNGATISNRSAASRRRRWWSTASCTSPRRGAWCTPSTCAPARRSGPTIRASTARSGYKGCCDVVNRGVALYKGKVFVGAYDGRLIALDAATGKVVWEKDTLIDHEHSYTITGAPRVFNGKVVIGNGGAEYGARGYVTAYDAETGKQAWRWFTVPGDPSKPFEDESMAAAAKTWDPAGKYWINGGGGTRVGHHHLRSRTEPGLYRHRQRLALGPQHAQPRRRRQPLSRLDRRAERRHRQIRLALSGNARRQLGLHLDPADDPGRPQHRRRSRAR